MPHLALSTAASEDEPLTLHLHQAAAEAAVPLAPIGLPDAS